MTPDPGVTTPPTDEQRSTEPHRIEWVMEHRGPIARITCNAEVGARCRTWCTEGCDERCTGGPEGSGEEHVWADQGCCGITPWLTESGMSDVAECYDGPAVPLRDGPISIWFNSDEVSWCYAEASK